MRFLLLTQYFPPEVGAPQVRLRAFAGQLRAQGHEVEVVTAMPNYPAGRVFDAYRGALYRREMMDGLTVRRTWIHAATGRRVMPRLLSYLSFTASSLVGCLLSRRPDVVIVESPPLFLGATAWLYSRLVGAGYMLVVSDLWPESAVQLGVLTNPRVIAAATWLERFLYRHADRVLAVTEGIEAAVVLARGRSETVDLVPNGVDVEAFRRVELPGGTRSGLATFVFAGTHGYAQGLDVILDAAEHLRDRRDVEFLLVGDGPEKRRLTEAARARRLDNVRFQEPVQPEAMPDVFSAARASIVPLRRAELFKGARPSKIFPALACETPVIFCGEGEAATLIEAAGCGLVVAPEDAGALAAAVRRLADDPDLARRLGVAGRAWVTASFSWQGIVAAWVTRAGIREAGPSPAAMP